MRGRIEIMNIEEMLTAQKELDQRIYDKHGLDPSALFGKKLTALIVELGEMANEARFFKYWSEDQDPRQELLEEYVDALHFFLSIAIIKAWARALRSPSAYLARTDRDTEDVFLETIGLLSSAYADNVDRVTYNGMERDEMAFHLAWINFMQLGIRHFHFSEQEIEAAYYIKNETNHQRQADGY